VTTRHPDGFYGERMLRALVRHRDPVIGVVLAVAITAELLAWDPPRPALCIALGLLSTLPFAVRRSMPFASFVAVQAGLYFLTQVASGFDNDSMSFLVAFVLALFSIGRHASGQEALWGVLGVLVVMIRFAVSEGGDLGDYAFVIAFVGGPWAAGITMRLRREREAVLHARNEQLRAEQEEATRRAVTAERATIARELHDVVSHAISVTVLQARGARRQLGTDEESVRRALDAIEQTNTSALSDMRRLLAVLRDTDTVEDAGDGHAPAPSLEHLPTLLDQVRESGVPVDLEVVGSPVAVPPGVDLSAYRIVQEALTNVIKHAGEARARVRLGYTPDALTVSIADDGRTAAEVGAGTGHGLVGIHERVSVVGGEVTAGPRDGGGFEVSARLPYSVELS
jgi:signal transduction histidine kinase